MSVTDLHPEDLLDREADGVITPNERAMLDAHLAYCTPCRLERMARADFAAEMNANDFANELAIHAENAAGNAAGNTGSTKGADMVARALEMQFHPEELLDRDEEGLELTAEERASLDAHLAVCAACRMERVVREDFSAELSSLDEEEPIGIKHGLVTRALESHRPPPPAPVLRAERDENLEDELASRRYLKRGRVQRNVGAAVIAAAVLMLASVAVAAGGGARVWNAIFSPPSDPAEVAPVETPAPAPKKSISAHKTADDVAPVACAPVPSVSPPPIASAAFIPSAVPVNAVVPVALTTSQSTPRIISVEATADANEMFSDANTARRRGDHATAGTLYRDLLAKHDTAPEAGPARLALGRMLLDDGDAGDALPLFDRYLADGDGALREEAMASRARAFEKMQRVDSERAAWTLFVASYPHSAHMAHAEARLEALNQTAH